ncbi:EAL domain-containing protein [Phenylobacterium sp.]|uniref:EAL domain-containing protein n=1 Tax=Phenylobacterium sp. TaxID=1871053 RepID=UPI002731C5C8|nr:EAL domain-containing protein [Phenylobacterium sp.]MDP1616891.1 EAL domain-containing protein [Phenylobacterium sp.]MDP1986233.1 EAL domain-containing protein [Phenylobacterium sp.]
MPLTPKRLLGFAFASADLLIEVSARGQISIALGAGEALAGSADRALEGAQLADFVAAEDRQLVSVLLDGLEEGRRAGPVVVRLHSQSGENDRAASLSAFRLPGNGGATSCVLSRASAPRAPGPHGLHDRATFETAAVALLAHAHERGLDIELAMIELAGFEAVAAQAGEPEASDMRARLAAVMRAESYAGASVAQLGEDRFALLREEGESAQDLSRRVHRLLALRADQDVRPVIQALGAGADMPADQMLKAIRYAVDLFLRDGRHWSPPSTLGEAFQLSVAQTLARVGALGRRVEAKDFALFYQPVVSLDGPPQLHHHEALIRFGDQGAPFPMIRMAEEMDLVCALDAAVVDKALEKLARTPGLTLAVNMSGRSVSKDAFVSQIKSRIASYPELRGRLMFELTESAAVADLDAADRRLQTLRALGCDICLDDFGAGASSLAYLQRLHVDVVKIDGAFIRELEHDSRGAAFIGQLARMCGEMKIATLAEMVETQLIEDVVRKAGVQMAQGWLYGAAQKEPALVPALQSSPPPTAAPARRRGAVDSWG